MGLTVRTNRRLLLRPRWSLPGEDGDWGSLVGSSPGVLLLWALDKQTMAALTRGTTRAGVGARGGRSMTDALAGALGTRRDPGRWLQWGRQSGVGATPGCGQSLARARSDGVHMEHPGTPGVSEGPGVGEPGPKETGHDLRALNLGFPVF